MPAMVAPVLGEAHAPDSAVVQCVGAGAASASSALAFCDTQERVQTFARGLADRRAFDGQSSISWADLPDAVHLDSFAKLKPA
eukprot:7452931-Pyramimonas_sp.AAC.1